jgi:hypothetical protein
MKVGDRVKIIGYKNLPKGQHLAWMGDMDKLINKTGTIISQGNINKDAWVLSCSKGFEFHESWLKKEENVEDYLKDEETVQAIKDSVEIWEMKKRGKKGGPCPLCVLFHEEREEECENCPLYIRGLDCNLPGSPYSNWGNERTFENAQNMVLALKSLFYPEPLPEEPKKKEVFYERGQRFIHENGSESILTQVDSYEICLIDLDSGNRWRRPLKIKSSLKITEEEFKIICDGETFTLKEDK